MADIYQGEIVSALHFAGIFTRSIPTLPPSKQARVTFSEADLVCIGSGKPFFIEVKTGHERLQLVSPAKTGNGWRADQREWAERAEKKYKAPYFLAAVVVTEYGPWSRLNRDVFIVPRKAVEESISILGEYSQLSLPYSEHTTQLVSMRKAGISMCGLWQEYRLIRERGAWFIPEYHPLYKYTNYPTV